MGHMKRPLKLRMLLVAATLIVFTVACQKSTPPDSQASTPGRPGTIKGHVRLMGPAPENPDIRMRSDPMCAMANAGQRVQDDLVTAGPDGSLANVFVQLQGTFPETAVPPEPVSIDQRGCIYFPRVVGVRVGQTLRVHNSDPGLHNVHAMQVTGGDEFNVGQPIAGMTNEFHLKKEGILHLQCDVHGWMAAYVGVMSHPYFAVTDKPGTFEIPNVPEGSYTIQAWHEVYGPLTSSVQVMPGGVANVEFAYSAPEKR
jgi:plastocyanin